MAKAIGEGHSSFLIPHSSLLIQMKDPLILAGREFGSRFILGSGKYSLKLIEAAVKYAGAEIITLAVRRANTAEHENILDYIPKGVTLLPNTSGARNAQEAVRIARLARELGCGDFVKIEIMRDSKYLLPDNQETVRATEILAAEGFVVSDVFFESFIFVPFCVSLQVQRNAKSTPAFLGVFVPRKQRIGPRSSRSTAPKPYFA